MADEEPYSFLGALEEGYFSDLVITAASGKEASGAQSYSFQSFRISFTKFSWRFWARSLGLSVIDCRVPSKLVFVFSALQSQSQFYPTVQSAQDVAVDRRAADGLVAESAAVGGSAWRRAARDPALPVLRVPAQRAKRGHRQGVRQGGAETTWILQVRAAVRAVSEKHRA